MTSRSGRFRAPVAADLNQAQRSLHSSILGGGRSSSPFAIHDDEGRLLGPFGPMLLAPAIGEKLQALGAAVRFDSSLTPREREIAILCTARHTRCSFEQWAHERVGFTVGMSAQELSDLADGTFMSTDAREQCVHVVTGIMIHGHGHLDDETFELASAVLGDEGTYELTVTVGYYVLIAMTLNSFGIEPPPTA